MNFVTKVKFKKEHRCFPSQWEFTPQPGINLLVGDQGCGKSTLLHALGTNQKDLISVTLQNPEIAVNTRYLDTEKHNPRAISDLGATHLPAVYAISARFKSHGQAMLPLVEACKTARDNIIFLDEPEAGLSVRSQYGVSNALQTAVSRGCQLFVATHSTILMELTENVFSLEHNQWMKTQDFIQSQKQAPTKKNQPTKARTSKAKNA